MPLQISVLVTSLQVCFVDLMQAAVTVVYVAN